MRKKSVPAVGVVSLVILLAVNVVLLTMLFRPAGPPISGPLPTFSPEVPDNSAAPSSPSINDPEDTPDPLPEEPSPTETIPSVAQPLPSGPATRLLAAVNSEDALRAVVGSCEDPGYLELSTDGGESWSRLEPGLTSIVRIRMIDRASFFAIGTNAECEVAQAASYSYGETWADRSNQLPASWYIDPIDRTEIHGLTASTESLCQQVTGLVGLDTNNAAALCGDGALYWTADGGAQWQLGATVPGLAAIASGPETTIIAAGYGVEPSCEGVSVHQIAGSGTNEFIGCATVSDHLELDPAEVAIGGTGDDLWLWIGDEILRSQDFAKSWI